MTPSVADPGFPRGNQLHQNKRNWNKSGPASRAPLLDPPMAKFTGKNFFVNSAVNQFSLQNSRSFGVNGCTSHRHHINPASLLAANIGVAVVILIVVIAIIKLAVHILLMLVWKRLN